MRVRGLVGASLLAILVASCGGSGGGGETTGPTTGPSTSSSIDVGDNFFSPTATTVPVGTTVTWTWRGGNQHDVSFASGTSSTVKSSGTFSRQFSAPGTYDYICTVHGAAMSGRVVVQ